MFLQMVGWDFNSLNIGSLFFIIKCNYAWILVLVSMCKGCSEILIALFWYLVYSTGTFKLVALSVAINIIVSSDVASHYTHIWYY